MEYLQAAVLLESLIKETNHLLLQKKEMILEAPNRMRVILDDGTREDIPMDSYTNDYVKGTLENLGSSKAFIMTDMVSTEIKGKDVTYLSYKAYHREVDKGLFFYQLVDKIFLSPVGSLRFSNLEDNIFYSVPSPQSEESSCNTMETDRVVENGKSIVFFIGHMDEERLIYDIQRLIFDTVNNVTRHPKLQFEFIIQIARYGAAPSENLRRRVESIEEYTKKHIYPEYPNATFDFIYEQEEN